MFDPYTLQKLSSRLAFKFETRSLISLDQMRESWTQTNRGLPLILWSAFMPTFKKKNPPPFDLSPTPALAGSAARAVALQCSYYQPRSKMIQSCFTRESTLSSKQLRECPVPNPLWGSWARVLWALSIAESANQTVGIVETWSNMVK